MGGVTSPSARCMSSSSLCTAEASLALSYVWRNLGKCYELCLGLGVVILGEGTGTFFSRRPTFGQGKCSCLLSLKVNSMILLVVLSYGH